MARPRAQELTERELEIMHVFWERKSGTVAEVRDALAVRGRELAYTTVATLVRILTEKTFLTQITDERPFRYQAVQSYEDVSGRLLGDLVRRVFRGSHEQLLLRLMDQRELGEDERAAVEKILSDIDAGEPGNDTGERGPSAS